MTSEQHVCAVNTSDIYSTSSKAYPLYSLYQRQRLHAPIDHGTVCCNNQMLLPSGTAVNWILTRRHRPSDSTDRCSDDAGLEPMIKCDTLGVLGSWLSCGRNGGVITAMDERSVVCKYASYSQCYVECNIK